MTDIAPSHQVVNRAVENPEDGYKRLMLAALRVARAKLRLILLEIDDIGIELKDGRLTAGEALVRCDYAGISPLFPGEGDGA
jgi:hypothetical protein